MKNKIIYLSCAGFLMFSSMGGLSAKPSDNVYGDRSATSISSSASTPTTTTKPGDPNRPKGSDFNVDSQSVDSNSMNLTPPSKSRDVTKDPANKNNKDFKNDFKTNEM